MSNPIEDFSVDGILTMLRSQGMRITRSRRGIMQALFLAERPLSLTEIQARALAEGGMLPDYATVFRMMILLERLKLVHKVNLKRSCSYFELTDPSKRHDHLVCTDCGKVMLLETAMPISEMERKIEADHGFTGVHHSLEFFGRCPDCSVSVPVAAPQPVAA